MSYPPKGAAKAEPVWGPIVFTYVLSSWFQKRVLERPISAAETKMSKDASETTTSP